ncbi:MAG: trigger factor [Cytophagales bacterium]|nr:hypothetical protein [Bernardetiaceae bacterium]MDW8204089.1 trigger factor [Cytophagales bacterium]
MEILFEKTDSLTALIKITLSEADYQERVEKKIKEYARTSHIKGFRPGKVPANIIRKMFGKSIKASEVSSTSADALENYLRDNDIQILGGPLMSADTQNDNYDWENQTHFEFAYEIGLRPPLKPTVDKNIVINKPSADVTDEQVEAFIEQLRRQHMVYEAQEQVPDMPTVVISGSVVTASGKPILIPNVNNPEEKHELFVTNSEGFLVVRLDEIPEHKSIFIGKSANDTVSFDARTLFPSDEQISQVFNIRLEHAPLIQGELVLKIARIAIGKLPEINQEFFDAILGAQKVQDEASFRAKLREIKEREAKIVQKEAMLNQFQDQLLKANYFALPDSFLKRWLSANNPNLSQEEIDRSYESYSDTMRFEMLIAELAKAKGIDVKIADIVSCMNDTNFMQMVRMGYFFMVGMEESLSMNMLKDPAKKNRVDDFARLTLLHKVFDAYAEEMTIQ